MKETQEISRGTTKLIKSTVLNLVAELNEAADELEKLVYSNEKAENILADSGSILNTVKQTTANYDKAFREVLDRIRTDSI
ncbi:MAG: hypothetical protein IJ587_02740 [Synergistaceae bacterium]|nr:hypothetical protein [Synergistaceae bacterium]